MKRLFAFCLFMIVLLSQGALADIVPIPDSATEGYPYSEEARVAPLEYLDESIHVRIEQMKHKKIICTIAYVTIADPSQLRTAMSSDRYDDHRYVKTLVMAKKANAVVAVNGDFFKYNTFGYTVRQGNVYRQRPDGIHDILLIDDLGDFFVLRAATEEMVQTFLDALPSERRIMNTFNFGPLLVENGQALPITIKLYAPDATNQRVALVQTGEKEYAMVHCTGDVQVKGSGLTMDEFAEFIADTIPEAKIAYNLDGGGSAHMAFMGKLMNSNNQWRSISDIVYFATAVPPKEGE